jgi:hypothetical protein
MSIYNVILGYGDFAFRFLRTIASDTADYNLYNDLISNGWNGTKPLKVVVTINSGVQVYASSTSSYAFTISSIPARSSITLINNGTIVGAGGNGGSNSSNPGGDGGPALYTNYATTITNNGNIWGGGGGGGGGADGGDGSKYPAYVPGGGGGGGAGRVDGAGAYYNGSAGTLTAGGAYGHAGGTSGRGGTGGDPGSAGETTNGSGGAAGFYVIGSSNITWEATGDRRGSAG